MKKTLPLAMLFRAVLMVSSFLVLMCLFGGCSPSQAADRILGIDTSEFGLISVYGQKTPSQHLAILFSSEQGLIDADRQAIDQLVEQGMSVAVIDTKLALSALKTLNEECLYLPGPLEWVSNNIQQKLNFEHYSRPVLLGNGEGALLVYISLAQAPPLAFHGGMSANLASSRLSLGKKFCDMDKNTLEAQSQRVDSTYPLDGWWRVGNEFGSMNPSVDAFIQSAIQSNENSVLLLSKPAALAKLYGDAATIVLRVPTAEEVSQMLKDLPLIEVSSQSKVKTLIIIYSGDGGWRDLDRSLGDLLKTQDFAVVGVDALRYFWSKRTPEETARDLTRIILHYRESWDIENIVLVGYSFGADILPFIYNRLPSELKPSVRLISLLAPTLKADFVIQVSDWFGEEDDPEALPIAPEVAKIDPDKLQCFYGLDEVDGSLCSDSVMRRSERISRPGGHHFDENYAIIANQINTAIKRKLANTH